MAHSSGPVQSVPNGRVASSGPDYRIAGQRLFFGEASVAFDYFIGSGSHGRSFAFAREGFLYELPVTWYQRRNDWAASPGYERESEVRLNRPLDTTCLYCHASRLQPIFGTQNKYATPPFLEDGIGCERCHGPGQDHVNNPRTARLMNPSKLPPEARDSVCAQCHLTADARIDRPGRRFAEYRPGDNLSAFATYFVQAGTADGLKVTSHVEKLAMSACARASGARLWCGTCHDTHTGTNRTQTACLDCHTQAHRQTEACADCHMPKATAIDAAHGVFTDHSIRRNPTSPRTDQARAPGLSPFLGTADDRSLGLALSELGNPQARNYLLRAQPADAPVQLRLATSEKDPRIAARRYAAVLKDEPANSVALVNLGVLLASAGNTEQAARLWTRALETNPALEGAALNLAKIQPAIEARRTLERYLTFNPGSRQAQNALKTLQ